jgi:hypothetical protein
MSERNDSRVVALSNAFNRLLKKADKYESVLKKYALDSNWLESDQCGYCNVFTLPEDGFVPAKEVLDEYNKF